MANIKEVTECDECKKLLRCWLFEMSEPIGDGFDCRHRAILCLKCARKPSVLKKHMFPGRTA